MTDRKGFRTRKVVDYSKFIENDSDSDDFALPNPKKSKSSNSARTASSDEKNRPNSKNDCVIVADKKPLQAPDRKDINDSGSANSSPVPDAKNKSEPSPSNSKERLTVVRSNEANSDSGHLDNNDDENPAHRDATLKKNKQSNDKPSKSATTTSKVEDGSRSNERNDKPTKVSSNSVQDAEKCSRVKWRPPASSKSAAASEKTKESLSPASSGLRLGLSRNARTKPLHSNVKLQR